MGLLGRRKVICVKKISLNISFKNWVLFYIFKISLLKLFKIINFIYLKHL